MLVRRRPQAVGDEESEDEGDVDGEGDVDFDGDVDGEGLGEGLGEGDFDVVSEGGGWNWDGTEAEG